MRKRRRKIRRIWKNNFLYDAINIWVRAAVKGSYSRFVSEGKENIPADSLVIFAANHCCTMMDPLVVLADYGRPVAYGARADMFSNPRTARILYFLKILPLARQRDGLSAVTENYDVFSNAVRCIENGVPFCLFPEGTHRPERGLQPLKKGAARIAVQAAQNSDKPVFIIPVGIDYEDFFNFKKAVAIRYGKSIPVSPEDNIKEITDTLTERLLGIIGNPPETKVCKALPVKILAAPVLALAAVFSAPMLIASSIILSKVVDKGWNTTVHFSCKFAFELLLTLFVTVPLLFFIPWYFALIYEILMLFSHRIFYGLLNIYK